VHQVVPQLPLQPVKFRLVNMITPWLCQQVRYAVMQLPTLSYCVHVTSSFLILSIKIAVRLKAAELSMAGLIDVACPVE
jgi:hypothetical protein